MPLQLQWQQRQSGDVTVVSRGDIVWARVQFPHRWWPALVLSSDGLGILVSFFENDVVSPTYFVESEVVPFESTFRSLMTLRNHINRCDTFYALLGSALRFLGQRVISSLTCRCQMAMKRGKKGKRKVVDGSDSSYFEPIGVLGFVRNVAVLPWVDEPDLVDAVRVVAQVHAFRDYSSNVQKRVYRETPKGGWKVQTVLTQESLALEPKDEYLTISKQGKKNTDIGAIVRFKDTVPVFDRNSEQLCENKRRIILEISTKNKESDFLKKISFDMNRSAFKMIRETQKREKMSILRFNNITDQVIVDICFRNCSTMKKTHFSVPCNSKTHSRSYANKRRRLDKPGLCDSSFTGQRILSFSTNEAFASAHMIKSREKKDDSDVSISSSALANSFSRFGMDMELYNNFMLYSPMKLKIQDSLRFTSTCGNSLMNLLPHSKDASSNAFPQIVKAQGIEGNVYISHIKMLEPEESIQRDYQPCIRFCETNMNFTDEIQKVDTKKSQVKDMLGSTSSIYQKKNGETTHLKSKNSARVKLSSRDYSMKDRDHCHRVASRSVFNSKVGQQSKTLGSVSSTSLHMKFPSNFNLPSKEELVKKFSVFGTVDYSKTRVFCRTGSAQVAFYEKADARAAHVYAKKKKVCFGDANVRFWLDPFEKKRIRFERFAIMPPLASKPVVPPLKSCLKRSNFLRKDSTKRQYRVRFTIET